MPIETVYDLIPLKTGDFLLLQDERRIWFFNPYELSIYSYAVDSLVGKRASIRNVGKGDEGEALILLEHREGLEVLRTDGHSISSLFEIKEDRKNMPEVSSFVESLYMVIFEKPGSYLIYDFQNGIRRWTKGNGLADTNFFFEFNGLNLPLKGQKLQFLFRDPAGRIFTRLDNIKGAWVLGDNDSFRIHPRTTDFYPLQMEADEYGNLAFLGDLQSDSPSIIRIIGPDNEFIKQVNTEIPANFENIIWGNDFTRHFDIGSNHGLICHFRKELDLQPLLVESPKDEYGISTRGMAKVGPAEVLITTEESGWYLYQIDSHQTRRLHPPANWPEDLRNLMYTRNIVKGPEGFYYMSCYAATGFGLNPGGYIIKWSPVTGFVDYREYPYRYEYLQLLPDNQLIAALHGMLVVIDRNTLDMLSEYHIHNNELLSKDLPQQMQMLGDSILLLAASSGLYKYGIRSRAGGVEIKLQDTLLNSFTVSVLPLPNNELLVGTFGDGLIRINLRDGKISQYRQADGLQNLNVCGVFADEKAIWITTFDGLYRYYPASETFKHFGREYDFTHYEFNRHSYLSLGSGEFLAGGLNGVNHIKYRGGQPDGNKQIKPVITSYSYMPAGDSVMRTFYHQKWQKTPIRIARYRRSLELEFMLPRAELLESGDYLYRIKKIEPKWRKLPDDGRLSFNYLPAGEHLLEVRSPSGEVAELGFPFIVQSWLYENPLFWILVAILLILLVTQFYRMKYQEKLALQISREAAERQEFKARVFSYITHEFKTPLAVLNQAVRWINREMDSSREKDSLSVHLDIIESNTRQMEDLAKQLSEIQMLEEGSWRPNLEPVEAVSFCARILENMAPLADAYRIKFDLDSELQQCPTMTDPQKLTSVYINLLSNALKHSPDGSVVTLKIWTEGDNWYSAVRDQGPGISEEELHRLFEPFYQSSYSESRQTLHSSGLGLTYVKYTIENLGGSLWVKNQAKGGAEFGICLPLIPSKVKEQIPAASGEKSRKQPTLSTAPGENISVLIVEDQPQLAHYMQKELEADAYQTLLASDGIQGWQLAREHLPDIVMSDVRMPGMNGFDLCNKIKEDFTTSHIPVILVTGLEGDRYKLTGLRSQADAYLTKPVNPEELKLTLRNLVENRKKLHKRYLKQSLNDLDIEGNLESESSLSDETRFVEMLKTSVQENIQDASYGPDQMAEDLNMSRSKFYRKLKAVLDESPATYLRMARLHFARKLLSESNLQINEIAYKCGFNDSSTFSRSFQKEFDASPSEFRSKKRQGSRD